MYSLRPLGRTLAQSQARTCFRCAFERPRIAQRPRPSIAQAARARYTSNTAGATRHAEEAARKTAKAAKRASKPRKRRRRLLITLGILLAGAGAVAFTETGDKVYNAVRRTVRVVQVLSTNIRDYLKTLDLKNDPNTSKDEYNDLLKACHKRCAVRTYHAMEANGSVFIKLGQHLTSLNYLLPSEWCDTFIPLQDQCPVTPFAAIKRMVEHDTGKPLTDLFSTFDETPLGAASLAQVHLATDAASGQRVAVKVQHPMLDDWAPLDLALTRFSFNTLKRVFPEYDLTWLSDEMQVSLPQELDFALEGANATRAQSYFAPLHNCPLVIPSVLWSARRILVMEQISGHRLDDIAYLESHNIDRDDVSASLSTIFNTMIFAPDAPLHCDPHGGNIAIRHNPNGRDAHGGKHNYDIILYDHGLYRTIPLSLQRSYARLWLAVLNTDEAGMRAAAYDVAGITDAQFPLFASAITGRDYRAVTKGVASNAQSEEEKEAISDALGEGLLQELIGLLGQVPRIILLILKTNDLTRSLDAKLQTKRGPMRSFLILARYAARTVLDEQLEKLRAVGRWVLWPPGRAVRVLAAYARYGVVVAKLGIYERWLWVRAVVGLENDMPGNSLMDEASG